MRIDGQDTGFDIHPVLGARGLQEPRRRLVPEPTRPEVNANPDASNLILKDVDIVIPGSNGAELLPRHFLQRLACGDTPSWIVEQIMVNTLIVVFPADTKTNRPPDVIHDRRDVGLDIICTSVRQDRLVPTSDIEANTAGRDGVYVRDHSADRHSITFVMVRHQRNMRCRTGARFDLRERALLDRRSVSRDIVNDLHMIPLSFGAAGEN